ncbi:MAG TPA: nuclear transport factor 2 family protein [Actinomycetota bacterium]|nr:nuclear transport factor 2 family protein [Actinomycetota bacterium]
MADKEDVEVVRRGYEAFIAADMEWLHEHLHENIVWHVGGANQLSGDYQGVDAVLAFFGKSVQVAIPEFDVHDIAAGDDHVVSVLNVNWQRPDGERFASRAVQVFHLGQRRTLESWFLVDDQAGLDQFLGAG